MVIFRVKLELRNFINPYLTTKGEFFGGPTYDYNIRSGPFLQERPGPKLDNRFLTLSGPGTGNGILMGLRKTGLKGG